MTLFADVSQYETVYSYLLQALETLSSLSTLF